MQSHPPTTYEIDRDDKIISVNDQFWKFAAENNWSATTQTVLGRPLWEFMADQGVILVYRILLEDVRMKGKSVVFPFRCDSPNYARHMTMAIAPNPDGAVLISTELDLEVAWHFTASPPPLVRNLCQRCRAFQLNHNWTPVIDALSSQLVDVGADRIMPVSCPECQTESRHHQTGDTKTELDAVVSQ